MFLLQGKTTTFALVSVANPGCLSRILILPIPDLGGSRISADPGSQILDPKTATKERGEKKFVVIPFFVAANFTKFKIIDPGSGSATLALVYLLGSPT